MPPAFPGWAELDDGLAAGFVGAPSRPSANDFAGMQRLIRNTIVTIALIVTIVLLARSSFITSPYYNLVGLWTSSTFVFCSPVPGVPAPHF